MTTSTDPAPSTPHSDGGGGGSTDHPPSMDHKTNDDAEARVHEGTKAKEHSGGDRHPHIALPASTLSTPTHDDPSSSASSSSSSSTSSPSSSHPPDAHDADSLASTLSSLSLSASSSSQQPPPPPSLTLRFLIASSQVGSIIGKAGANVRSVREGSGCFVSILKSEYRDVTERVMEVKGGVDALPMAVERIAELLVLAQRERGELRDEDEAPYVSLVLLLHRGLVGSIIGRAGVLVKDTQSASGARVQVSNDVLVGSTEKPVTVLASTHGMREAFRRIALQISDSEGKAVSKTVQYVPTPSSLQSPFASAAFPYPQAAHHHRVLIPSACAGIVIGRGGETIKNVRAQSGCSISIEDEEGGGLGSERVVHIIGSVQGIQLAVFYIRTLIEGFHQQHVHAGTHALIHPHHQQHQHQHGHQQQQAIQHMPGPPGMPLQQQHHGSMHAHQHLPPGLGPLHFAGMSAGLGGLPPMPQLSQMVPPGLGPIGGPLGGGALLGGGLGTGGMGQLGLPPMYQQ